MFIRFMRSFLLLTFATFLATACIVEKKTTVVQSRPAPPKPAHSKPLPPGQAKKAAGTQSAKPFAPGQQKKK